MKISSHQAESSRPLIPPQTWQFQHNYCFNSLSLSPFILGLDFDFHLIVILCNLLFIVCRNVAQLVGAKLKGVHQFSKGVVFHILNILFPDYSSSKTGALTKKKRHRNYTQRVG